MLCCRMLWYVVAVFSVCSVNCHWISTVQCGDKCQQTVQLSTCTRRISLAAVVPPMLIPASTFSAQSQHYTAQWVWAITPSTLHLHYTLHYINAFSFAESDTRNLSEWRIFTKGGQEILREWVMSNELELLIWEIWPNYTLILSWYPEPV